MFNTGFVKNPIAVGTGTSYHHAMHSGSQARVWGRAPLLRESPSEIRLLRRAELRRRKLLGLIDVLFAGGLDATLNFGALGERVHGVVKV
jgi:hypothetical protein